MGQVLGQPCRRLRTAHKVDWGNIGSDLGKRPAVGELRPATLVTDVSIWAPRRPISYCQVACPIEASLLVDRDSARPLGRGDRVCCAVQQHRQATPGGGHPKAAHTARGTRTPVQARSRVGGTGGNSTVAPSIQASRCPHAGSGETVAGGKYRRKARPYKTCPRQRSMRVATAC